MSHKAKSFFYFASLVIALVSYYNMEQADNLQATQLAENTMENTTALKGLE